MKQNYSPYTAFIIHVKTASTASGLRSSVKGGTKKFPILLRHVLKPLKTRCVILYKVNRESS